METTPQKPEKLNKWTILGLSFELGYIIAIPLVVLGLLGKWGDSYWHHSFPWMTLMGVGFAIGATTIWITKKVKNYIK